MSLFKDNALRALGCGYSVFPVVCFVNLQTGKREKIPLVKNWQDFLYYPPSTTQIDEWDTSALISSFGSLGIPTGDGFFVVDFDASKPIEPLELEEQFDWYEPEKFPAWVRTGGGGLHLYVKGETINATNIFKVDKKTSIAVDIRGTGGYVVAPGSRLWSDDPRKNKNPTLIAEYKGELVAKNELPLAPDILTRARVASPGLEKFEDSRIVPRGQGERHGAALALAMSMVNRLKDGSPEEVGIIHEAFKRALESRFENTNAEEEEYRVIFDTAVKKRKQEKGIFWSEIKPIVNQTITEVSSSRDLNKWAFTPIKTVRINDMLRMTIGFPDDPIPRYLQMEVKDLYNQNRFREAYTVGTNRIIERISKGAYDKFISAINIEEMKDTGVSAIEMVDEALRALTGKVREAKNEVEYKESMRLRGMVRWQGKLVFKMSKFRNEYELRGVKPTVIAQVLENLKCKIISRGVYEYTYEPDDVQ